MNSSIKKFLAPFKTINAKIINDNDIIKTKIDDKIKEGIEIISTQPKTDLNCNKLCMSIATINFKIYNKIIEEEDLIIEEKVFLYLLSFLEKEKKKTIQYNIDATTLEKTRIEQSIKKPQKSNFNHIKVITTNFKKVNKALDKSNIGDVLAELDKHQKKQKPPLGVCKMFLDEIQKPDSMEIPPQFLSLEDKKSSEWQKFVHEAGDFRAKIEKKTNNGSIDEKVYLEENLEIIKADFKVIIDGIKKIFKNVRYIKKQLNKKLETLHGVLEGNICQKPDCREILKNIFNIKKEDKITINDIDIFCKYISHLLKQIVWELLSKYMSQSTNKNKIRAGSTSVQRPSYSNKNKIRAGSTSVQRPSYSWVSKDDKNFLQLDLNLLDLFSIDDILFLKSGKKDEWHKLTKNKGTFEFIDVSFETIKTDKIFIIGQLNGTYSYNEEDDILNGLIIYGLEKYQDQYKNITMDECLYPYRLTFHWFIGKPSKMENNYTTPDYESGYYEYGDYETPYYGE